MPVIQIETRIRASLEACFDLARSVDMHVRSTAVTNDVAVGGVTSGLLDFTSPWGPLRNLAHWLFLRSYLERFLKKRAEAIREEAESRT